MATAAMVGGVRVEPQAPTPCSPSLFFALLCPLHHSLSLENPNARNPSLAAGEPGSARETDGADVEGDGDGSALAAMKAPFEPDQGSLFGLCEEDENGGMMVAMAALSRRWCSWVIEE